MFLKASFFKFMDKPHLTSLKPVEAKYEPLWAWFHLSLLAQRIEWAFFAFEDLAISFLTLTRQQAYRWGVGRSV